MLRKEIAYDELSCAMHWECIAYDKHSLCNALAMIALLMISLALQFMLMNKHSCAMHWVCIAYDRLSYTMLRN